MNDLYIAKVCIDKIRTHCKRAGGETLTVFTLLLLWLLLLLLLLLKGKEQPRRSGYWL